MHECVVIYWSTGHPLRTICLKDSDSPSPSGHQSPLSYLLSEGIEHPISLLHSGMLSGLMLCRSHTGRHDTPMFICEVALLCLTPHPLPVTSAVFSSVVIPEPWGRSCDTEMPYRAKRFTLSYCPHVCQLQVSMLLQSRENEASLVKVWRCIQLNVE